MLDKIIPFGLYTALLTFNLASIGLHYIILRRFLISWFNDFLLNFNWLDFDQTYCRLLLFKLHFQLLLIVIPILYNLIAQLLQFSLLDRYFLFKFFLNSSMQILLGIILRLLSFNVQLKLLNFFRVLKFN